VRAIFSSVLGERDRAAGQPVAAMLDGGGDESAVRALLAPLGFRDLHQAAKHLRVLGAGSVLADGRAPEQRMREAFRGVADQLLRAAGATPDPDLTLQNIATLVSAQRFPEVFFRQLAVEETRHLVVGIASSGLRTSRALARDPLMLERLIGDPAALGGEVADPPDDPDALASYRVREETRLVARHVLGLGTFDELTGALSTLADRVVGAVLARPASAGRRRQAPSLAVFALGKYGTGELGLDADLDLVFLTGERTSAGRSAAEKRATDFVRTMTGSGPEGRLYEIDARLRPEGRNAPLVAERDGYGEYLRTRASLWERQSLTRLRFVGGDAALGAAVLEDVRAFVYGTPLPPGWAGEIVAMRRKTETRSRARAEDLVDIKLGAGGMVDLEFLAQMALLAGRAGRVPNAMKTTEVLGRIPPGVLPSAPLARGVAAYRYLRSVEFRLRSVAEERGSVLPDGPLLERIARVMGHARGEDLRQAVAGAMRDSRSLLLEGASALSLTPP
jgi:glutamate-ammonia-ligase adenylyltransferase